MTVKVTLEYPDVTIEAFLPSPRTEAVIDYLADEGVGEVNRIEKGEGHRDECEEN